jgi:hypothetical protein
MSPEEFAEQTQEKQVTRTGMPTMVKKEPDMPLWVMVLIFLLAAMFHFLLWSRVGA